MFSFLVLLLHLVVDGQRLALALLMVTTRPPPAAVHAPPPLWLPGIVQQLLPLLLERQINIRFVSIFHRPTISRLRYLSVISFTVDPLSHLSCSPSDVSHPALASQ